ncbi:MAG: hypothetical protein R3C60_05100 [Parvularculaceae bacterium]
MFSIKSLVLFSAAICLASCSRVPNVNVLDAETNAITPFASTKCTKPNADGENCDEKQCTKDVQSDCKSFANKCLEFGHKYEGTADGGTCSRVSTPNS